MYSFDTDWFVDKIRKKASRDARTIERLKRVGTLSEKVGYLFRLSPILKQRKHIHLLLMSYWTVFDSVDDMKRIVDATPSESITRTRRLIIETEFPKRANSV